MFTEQDELVALPRGLLTVRACWRTMAQLRAEHASVAGLARLGRTPKRWEQEFLAYFDTAGAKHAEPVVVPDGEPAVD